VKWCRANRYSSPDIRRFLHALIEMPITELHTLCNLPGNLCSTHKMHAEIKKLRIYPKQHSMNREECRLRTTLLTIPEDTWPLPSLEEPGKSPGVARIVAKSAMRKISKLLNLSVFLLLMLLRAEVLRLNPRYDCSK
jgi:hypothetical protein